MNAFFESVYHEAKLKETKFDVLKEDDELRAKFREYNKLYFNDKLWVNKIGWSYRSSSRRLGACVKSMSTGNVWIELNPILKDHIGSDTFRDVLVHEMIHIIEPNHSEGFIREMERVNKDFGLHVTVTVDTETEAAELLNKFQKDSLDRRADRIKNNKNKPELQEMYDELNAKYFEGKLPDNTIIEYLPKKTYQTYGLGQVRADENSDWVFKLRVARDNTKECMLKGMVPIYAYGVLNVSRKKLDAETDRLHAELSAKTDNFTNI